MSTAKKIPRICEWSKSRPLIGIAALARNRVIGRNGKLPWRLPEDFKHFKATTMGGALIMGRVSYEEIGRPLPGRETIVLSGTATEIPGVTIVRDWAEIGQLFPEKQLFLAGGAQLYEQGLLMCKELILTHVNLEPDGDAFFPPYRDYFDDGEVLSDTADFTIRRHRRLHR